MHTSLKLQQTLKSCSHLQVPARDMQNACNETASQVKTEQQDIACSREWFLLQVEEKEERATSW